MKTDLVEGVWLSLAPEINQIEDASLAEKIAQAYATALAETEFTSLDQIRCSGMVGLQHIPWLTQSDHLRGVGRLSRLLASELNALYGEEPKRIDLDLDLALAAGLAHDVGKPFFYDPANIRRWEENKVETGQPPFRHTFYGAHLALQAGLPIEIAHVVACHDIRMEGQYVTRSVYLDIVAHADSLYWQVPFKLGVGDSDPTVIDGPMP